MNAVKTCLILISTLICSVLGFAQNAGHTVTEEKEYFKLGIVERIHSQVLDENRTLNIYLPEGYLADSPKTYPVIFLLDGSANEDFIHVVGIVQFLTMIEAMPKSILIGIANVDRKRDFTFPTSVKKDKASYPTTGSSAKFIDFLEQELEPYVRSHYKTSASKTIIGQSLGGLLATEILLKKPYLFDRYIIVSPSLWWDNESLLKSAPSLLQKQNPVNSLIYISVGKEGEQMEGDAKQLVDDLRTTRNHVIFQPLPEENHLTILHNSVYKAFERLNADPEK